MFEVTTKGVLLAVCVFSCRACNHHLVLIPSLLVLEPDLFIVPNYPKTIVSYNLNPAKVNQYSLFLYHTLHHNKPKCKSICHLNGFCSCLEMPPAE